MLVTKVVKEVIHANGIDIGIYTEDFQNEYISITDIARYKSDEPTAVIQNWMRNRDVIEFLGLWETLHNSNFKHHIMHRCSIREMSLYGRAFFQHSLLNIHIQTLRCNTIDTKPASGARFLRNNLQVRIHL